MVGSHKETAPLDQSFQAAAACMTLGALLRKVEARVGERMAVDREDVPVGVGEEAGPAAAGRRKRTAWTAENQGVLAGKAGNEAPDEQQAVEEEEGLPVVVAPCTGVEEGGLADGEGGVDDEGVGPLDKVVYQAIAVLAETVVVVVVPPKLFGCGLKPTTCSPHQDEASPCWIGLL